MDDFFSSPKLFRFGVFEADVENAFLTRKGIRIRLQDQPFRILAILLEHAGQIVTRDDLQRKLWPTGTYVDFEGSLNAALKRLRAALEDDADNPRFVETVPKRGYRFIAPVTVARESAPAKSAPAPETNVATPVASPSTPTEVDPGRSVAKTRILRIRLRVAAVIVFVAAFAVAGFIAARKKAAAHTATSTLKSNIPVTQRRSVAVLGFHNASGRSGDGWLSTALTEMLRTELGAGDELRVVPGEDVTQFRLGAPWSATDSLSPATASRVGKALEGDLLVLGSYTTLGDPQSESVRVDFRLQEAQTGEILYEGAETGAEKQFFGVAAKVGVALRERLGLPMVTESEEVGVLTSLPSDADADRFYSLGLEKMRQNDVATAKDLFLQAERIAPNFAQVHLMLARAWGALGYDQKSRVEAKKSFDLSASLPETDKLLAAGAYYESLRDTDRAASTYRAVLALHPDSVDDAVRLIAVLNAVGRHEEGLAIIKQLRQFPPPVSDDPRIDFWEGQLTSYSKPSAAQPFFDKAVAETAARGEKLLYARFRLQQCISLIYGNHPTQGAEAYCQEAHDIFISAGNRLYAADALRAIGDRRGAEGDLTGAREIYRRALAILSTLDEHEKTGVVLNNMAITYENQGQIEQSEGLFKRAAENWSECGDTVNEATALGNLGDVLMERGELRQAEKQYESAREKAESSGSTYFPYYLYSIAVIRLYEGDVTGADQYTTQALAMARERDDAGSLASIFAAICDIRLAQGDLSAARQNCQQALALQQQLGKRQGIAENQASLAALSIEEGKPAEADTALRKSLAEFQTEKTIMDEIQVETDLARALLMEGKFEEASKMISDASKLSRDSRDPSLKLPIAIGDARIRVAQIASSKGAKRDFSGPREELQTAISTARRLDYFGIECEARLALGEIELRTAPALGRSHLAALAEQAREHGLQLVARRASELQDAPALAAKPTVKP